MPPLGLRVILLDFNLVNVKYQRALIWGLTGLGLVVFVLIWKSVILTSVTQGRHNGVR